ncbi:hypothetical protein EFR01_18750 [Sinorhizobium fredii]|nr:hypothetical protein EFR01_18750 [Sinorhizobium fredii]GLS09027.1 hypothetical protein GCM10007864_26570 [Sinorhizobium fredii]
MIRGQVRLETKIDTFLGAQTAMKTEIDGMKADTAEIKSWRRAANAYISRAATRRRIHMVVAA